MTMLWYLGRCHFGLQMGMMPTFYQKWSFFNPRPHCQMLPKLQQDSLVKSRRKRRIRKCQQDGPPVIIEVQGYNSYNSTCRAYRTSFTIILPMYKCRFYRGFTNVTPNQQRSAAHPAPIYQVVPVDASPKAWEAARYFLHLGWQIGLTSNDGLGWDPYGDFFGYRCPLKQ